MHVFNKDLYRVHVVPGFGATYLTLKPNARLWHASTWGCFQCQNCRIHQNLTQILHLIFVPPIWIFYVWSFFILFKILKDIHVSNIYWERDSLNFQLDSKAQRENELTCICTCIDIVEFKEWPKSILCLGNKRANYAKFAFHCKITEKFLYSDMINYFAGLLIISFAFLRFVLQWNY